MNPRELIRAAQAQELAGDWAGAIERLEQAAAHYRESGKASRAEQLTRHAERLAERTAIAVVPETVQPERSAQREAEGAASHESVPSTSPLRGYARGERDAPSTISGGPVRADPAQEAWCSFCCRPGRETGALVAGPTGAFICRACVDEAFHLLEKDGPGKRRSEGWTALRQSVLQRIEELRELVDRIPPLPVEEEEPTP